MKLLAGLLALAVLLCSFPVVYADEEIIETTPEEVTVQTEEVPAEVTETEAEPEPEPMVIEVEPASDLSLSKFRRKSLNRKKKLTKKKSPRTSSSNSMKTTPVPFQTNCWTSSTTLRLMKGSSSAAPRTLS